jgi:hypothetical protein
MYMHSARLLGEERECVPVDGEQLRIVLETQHDVKVEQRCTQEERIEAIQHTAVSVQRINE